MSGISPRASSVLASSTSSLQDSINSNLNTPESNANVHNGGTPAYNNSLNLELSEELMSIGFNQDGTCFSCATTLGYSLHSCEPFKKIKKRVLHGGGLGIACMQYQSNLLALVGGGRQPCFPPNVVTLWDDATGSRFAQITFDNPVKAVHMRRDLLVVVLEYEVFLYKFVGDKAELADRYKTGSNPNGICAVNTGVERCMVAFPSITIGDVQVVDLVHNKTMLVRAHNSALACIALSSDGTYLATSSNKGTLIRVYRQLQGGFGQQQQQVEEFRRGTDPATIYGISFSPDSKYICTTSSKGTLHLFALNDSEGEELQNRRSSFSMFQNYLPSYFSSKWSSVKWYFGKEDVAFYAVFAPTLKHTLFVISMDGAFRKVVFDPQNCEEKFLSYFHKKQNN